MVNKKEFRSQELGVRSRHDWIIGPSGHRFIINSRKVGFRARPLLASVFWLLTSVFGLLTPLLGQSTAAPFRVTNLQGVTNLNNQRYASQFSGANAGAKIAACIADLPAEGGTCIADFTGTQTITTDPFAGVTKPGVLTLGSAVFQVSTTLNIPTGWSLIGTYSGKIWGLPDEPNTGTTFLWTGGTGQPVIKIFNSHQISLRGFSVDCNYTANSTAILIDSTNNPPVTNIDIRDFNLYRAWVGIQWGTGALPDTPGYEVDKIQIFNGVIDSGIVGSKGIVIQGANKGQDSKIQAVTMVNIDTGIDLSGSYSYLDIEDCSIGSAMSPGHTDAIVSIGTDNLVIKGGSSERVEKGGHFIHNIASPYNAGSVTTTIMSTRVNDPIVLEGGAKFLSIGNASGTIIPSSISGISRSGNVVTVTTSAPHNLTSSDFAIVAGVVDASFNGSFAVASAPDDTHFTYAQTGANASSSGGTALESLAVLNGTSNMKVTSIGDYLNNELGWTVMGAAQLVKLQESAASFPNSLKASSLIGGTKAVSFSATPTFDVALGNTQSLTLTGNVTSSTLSNAVAGQTLYFKLCQDATGGRTFAWPSNFKMGSAISKNASTCTHQSFVYDGTNARALGPGEDDTGIIWLPLVSGWGGAIQMPTGLIADFGSSNVQIYSNIDLNANRLSDTSHASWVVTIGNEASDQILMERAAATTSAPNWISKWQVDNNGISSDTATSHTIKTVTFSTTPTFDVTTGGIQKITLTGNVTSSTLSGAPTGGVIYFLICQDGTGSRTFTWPTNVKGGMTIGSTASKCSAQPFAFDGTNAYALSAGVTNM